MRKAVLMSVCALAVLTIGALQAAATSTCPAIGFANDCNLILTVNSNLTITSTVTGQPAYDGVEDQLVGVVNNSKITVTSINLTGSSIFDFDSDGAGEPGTGCLVNPGAGAPNPCSAKGPFGPTGYEGPGTSFNITDSNDGTVLFNPGLAPGGIAWFSLEEAASANVQGGGVNNATPEPASMLLVGSGLVGLFLKRRRS